MVQLKYNRYNSSELLMLFKYKKLPNEVGGAETCQPENVKTEMKKLLNDYNAIEQKSFEQILEFHKNFESIHPFQDGNGRVGRLIMFKECLANNIVPFIIDEEHKLFYYRGLKEWDNEKGYLIDTCLSCQDKYKAWLDYSKIEYVCDSSNGTGVYYAPKFYDLYALILNTNDASGEGELLLRIHRGKSDEDDTSQNIIVYYSFTAEDIVFSEKPLQSEQKESEQAR